MHIYLVSVTVVASDSSVDAEDLLLSVMLSFSRASVGTSLQGKSAAQTFTTKYPLQTILVVYRIINNNKKIIQNN